MLKSPSCPKAIARIRQYRIVSTPTVGERASASSTGSMVLRSDFDIFAPP